MKFTIDVNMDGAAIQDGGSTELIMLLHKVVADLRTERPLRGYHRWLMDTNGNTVGEAKIR
jgi:hypothetical protein